jgi:protein-S-isoprenylcysteine O-methyltransferase Ste14
MTVDPRSRLFPPLITIVAVVLGVGVQYLHALPLVAQPAGRWIGGVLIFAWLAVAIWAVGTFRRAGTTPDPRGDVSAFVATGPFRFSRNPMYLANVAFQVGVALVLDNPWILILVPVAWLLYRVVIVGEERYLTGKFGQPYDEYRLRVRRWL